MISCTLKLESGSAITSHSNNDSEMPWRRVLSVWWTCISRVMYSMLLTST